MSPHSPSRMSTPWLSALSARRRGVLRVLRPLAWGTGLVLSACDRPAPAVPVESARVTPVTPPADSAAAAPAAGTWDGAAGPFVVLPTVDGGMVSGSLLLPLATDSTVGDTTGVARLLGDGRVELFSRSGPQLVGRVSVEAPPRGEPGCTAWPVARLSVDAGVTITPWTVAFAQGRVTAVALDSIEGMAPRDSASLAATLTRLASRLPDDTSATFRGLPFVVLRAWRATATADAIVVAVLARRVNQEDNPLEERVVLVVDAPGADATAWRVGWHERAAGHEEELVVAEPLLAFRTTGANDLRLLFGRDDGVALGAAMLVRQNGEWRVLWESAIAGCG